MASDLQLWFRLAAFICVLQLGEGSGTIEILMERFKSTCTDHGGLDQCDTYFIFCIDKPGAVNVNSCSYKRIVTGHYHNDNTMNFGSSIQGQDNPLKATTSSFESRGANDVMFSMRAMDKDTITSNDHIVTFGIHLSDSPAASKSEAAWKSVYKRKGSSHVWFKYQFYCDASYYTTKCNKYCKARDDNHHYTCISETGEKKCMRGWTGENCNIDNDECQLSPCYHNAACTNLPGWYNCTCPNGYAGQNCDLEDSLCHSAPCQNGGWCEGTMQEYNCTCSFEWKGQNCETPVDFCESNPCQNNATCFATLGNYTCACALGWTGYHCTTEVNACDSSPCKNGGTCIKEPREKYECSCPEEYEGEDCQTLKNPCDPNPCQNSGNCSKLTFDTYNCWCVFGWEGDNCVDYLNVTSADKHHQTEDKKGVDLLAILLGVLSATIVVVVLLVLLCIRRWRRNKKVPRTALGDKERGVVPVAFPNALYDETNRANAMLEARSNRAPMPVPTCASCVDGGLTKAKVLDDGPEEGAVGGANPYQDIDGYQTPVKCVSLEGAVGGAKASPVHPYQTTAVAGLDTRTMAGDRHYDNPRGVDNDYADFEDLKRRSESVTKAAGYANLPDSVEQMEEAEENHYQELDDVLLAIQTTYSGPTVTFSPPAASAFSHYDTPRSVSTNPTPSGNETSTGSCAMATGNDVTPTGNAVSTGYMNMEGNASREVELESLQSSADEEEEADQEDIKKLRGDVWKESVKGSEA